MARRFSIEVFPMHYVVHVEGVAAGFFLHIFGPRTLNSALNGGRKGIAIPRPRLLNVYEVSHAFGHNVLHSALHRGHGSVMMPLPRLAERSPHMW